MRNAKGLLAAVWKYLLILRKLPVRYGFAFLDLLVPKDKRLAVFGSGGGKTWYSNSRALYEYILNHPCGLKVYYYQWRRPDGVQDRRCLYGVSWRTAYIILRAKTLVSTHGTGDFLPYMCSRRKLFVQTWHGIPMKGMLFTDKGLSAIQRWYALRHMKYYDVFLAPSRWTAWLICSDFKLDPRKILLCGLPKNEVLLGKGPRSRRLQDFVPGAASVDKIILYAPTYRRFARTRLFPFDDFDAKTLDRFLAKHNAAILLRLHINDAVDIGWLFSDRILDVSFDVCPEVNDVLPDVDVLVTDYSTIYQDFLLTDRPIVFVPYDLDEFERKRGLVIDDYDFWTPGPKVHCFAEFLSAIDDAFERPEMYSQARKIINPLVNYYQDGSSCGKIVETIKKRSGVQ